MTYLLGVPVSEGTGDVVGEGLLGGSARLAEAVGVREAEVDLFGYPGEPPWRDRAWARCRLGGVVGGG